MSEQPVYLTQRPSRRHDTEKEFEADDPYELTGVRYPVAPGDDADRETARTLIEEFALQGWSRAAIAALFADPHAATRMQFIADGAPPYSMGFSMRFSVEWKRARDMATVHNWQIGRDMEFPYETAPAGWQFAAVFNINRCIGCQTCTMACKSTWTHSPGQELMWWNNVETKPYGGYPANWDLNTLDILNTANPGGQTWTADEQDDPAAPYGTFDGVTIFEADARRSPRPVGYLPTEAEWKAPNAFEDHATRNRGQGAELPEHDGWFFYLQRICNHCTHPACLAVCPRTAIYKRPEDGIVLVDQARCRGYRACVEACPYKKTMYRPTTGTTEKCIGCYPRIEGGDPLTDDMPTETRCMTACVGKIRLQGLAQVDDRGDWVEDPTNPLYFLVHEAKVALPLYPQFGTQPNVYYIPPRWVPRAYLRQMFGPGVDAAIERYANPSRKLLAVLQLFRVTQKIIFSFAIEEGEPFAEINVAGQAVTLYDDTAIGYGRDGSEIVRVNVNEPVVERPDKLNSI